MKEIIFTALLTSVLTVAGSYYLMGKQLSSEQDYWLSRQTHERSEALLDKRIDYIEKLNTAFFNLDKTTRDLKMDYAKLQAELQVCYKELEISGKMNPDCKGASSEFLTAQKRYYEQVSQISVVNQMLPLYFSGSVSGLIPNIENMLLDNSRGVMDFQKKISVDPDDLDRDPGSFFPSDMGPIDDVENIRLLVIGEMLQEVTSQQSKLFTEN